MTPDQLAQDLQQAVNDLRQEREHTQRLLVERDRQNAELYLLRSALHRESNSRLLAEESLDETRSRLQLAVDTAELVLWDWKLPTQQVFLTARWGEWTGDIAMDAYWSVADLQSRVHPEDLPALQAHQTALRNGTHVRAALQYRVRTPAGWRWIEDCGMVALHDSQGKPLRLLGTLADISERKRVQQNSVHTRALTEQTSHSRSEFLTHVSHEVRTPLNALVDLTRRLLDSPLSAQQTNWLSQMDRSTQALLALLDDMLDLARIEAGQLELADVRLDLAPTIEEALGRCAEQARSKPLDLTWELAPNLPQAIMGDPGRLRQMLGHLLTNALKATPSGGRVSVHVRVDESPDDAMTKLQLQVKISGAGIAGAHHASIFDAFAQTDASTPRNVGSGLGLTVCARLARLMGGEIGLTSELGVGSTFSLILPLRAAPALAADGSLSEPLELSDIAQSAGSRYAGLVLLLAEDNLVNALLLRQLLLRLGCTVRVARGGAQAVALWEQGGIDLVLMDVQMPGMSGLQATQKIRELETRRKLQRTPVLAVTANARPSDREQCLAAGMDGYTTKPVRPHALMAEMDRVLKRTDAGPVTLQSTPAPPPSPTVQAAPPAALDVATLRRRQGGDDAALKQLAQAMRTDLAERQRAMQLALKARDSAAAVTHAHGLKGSLGSMAAARGARLAKGLELAARAGDWHLFERALTLLQAEARQIDATLAQLLDPTSDKEGGANQHTPDSR